MNMGLATKAVMKSRSALFQGKHFWHQSKAVAKPDHSGLPVPDNQKHSNEGVVRHLSQLHFARTASAQAPEVCASLGARDVGLADARS